MEANITSKKIRVLLVIDTTIKRSITANGLVRERDITVCGMVSDIDTARHHLKQYTPDVIVVDTDTPDIDVPDFLCMAMQLVSAPIILMSPTSDDDKPVLDALAMGAISVLTYSKINILKEYTSWMQELCHEIRNAARANIRTQKRNPCEPSEHHADDALDSEARQCSEQQIIVIGASAGGVDALSRMLPLFPASSPGIVIVQHMPAGYTHRFAGRLNMLSQVKVKEAEDGDLIQPGRAFLAPGSDYQTVIEHRNQNHVVSLRSEERYSGHRPSVDRLFESAAQVVGHRTAAILLTGMGADGAKGMLKIRYQGGLTFAQNEESCIVFGMPGAANKLGAVQQLLPLEDIPGHVIHALKDRACRQPAG